MKLRLSILLILVSSMVFSQKDTTDYFNLSLEELMNLEVYTASKKAEKIIEAPSVVNVLTSSEIRTLNFNTLEEILGYVSGISSLSAEGNVFTTTTVRGNTLANYNTNTLLLFNGVPIYNAYHGSFNLNTIALSSIDRIEVVKGSNSVLYGTNAINAVINIIPKRTKEGQEASNTLNVKYGSFNTGKVSASHLYSKGDVSINIYGDGYYTSGQNLNYYDQNDGSMLEMQKKLSSINIASIIEYKNLSFQFQFFNSNVNNLDENSLLPVYSFEDTDIFTLFWPQRTEEHQLVSSLSYDKAINDNLSFKVSSTFQDWEMNKDEWTGKKIYSSWGSFNDLEINYNINDKWTNKFGVSFNHYLGKRDRERIVNDVKQNFTDVESDLTTTSDYAAYINGNYNITSKLAFHYGARYYASTYDGTTNDNLSPRFSFVYQLKDNLYVKTIYGNSFRVPTYFEKSSEIKSIYGNDQLKPETSTSYDLVISNSNKRLSWDVNLFYTEIDNKIVRVAGNDKDAQQLGFMPKQIFKNTGSYNFWGVETNTKFNLNDKIYGFINYAFVEAENNDNDPELIGDDPWFYNHMIASGINYKPVSLLEATLSCKYLSKWGFGTVSDHSYTAADPSFVANLGLNVYPLSNNKFCIELKVDNLLNEDIYVPEIVGRNLENAPVTPYNIGRKGYIGLSYRF